MKILLFFSFADAHCAALAASLQPALSALGHAVHRIDCAGGAMPDAAQADLVLYLAGDTGTAATQASMEHVQGMLCLLSAAPAAALCPWALGVLASPVALAPAMTHCAGPVQPMASGATPAAMAQQVLALGLAAMHARPALAAMGHIGAQLAHWGATPALRGSDAVLAPLAVFQATDAAAKFH